MFSGVETVAATGTSGFRSRLRNICCYLVLPLVLIAVSAVLRFVSLKKPGIGHDEQITRAVAQQFWNGDLSNNWKHAPNMPEPFRINSYNFSSYMYADALAVGRHTRHPLFRERTFSAVLATLAVVLFYFVALSLFGLNVALPALALLSVFPLLVQDAHYARPDAFVTFLSGILCLCSVRLLSSRRLLTWLAAASFCCGLMIACKVSMGAMAIIPLLALYGRKAINWRTLSLWAGLTFAGFCVGVPGAIIHPDVLLAGIQNLRNQYANEHPPHSLVNSKYSFGLLFPYLWQTLGPLACLLSLAGFTLLLWRKHYVQFALVAGGWVFYLVYFGLQRVFFERNLSHVAPLIAVLFGVGAAWLASFAPKRIQTIFLAVLTIAAVAAPAQIAYKLVYVAMRISPKDRAKTYQHRLSQREGLPVEEEAREFLMPGHVDEVVSLAETSASDIIITIRDYNDGYTRRSRRQLQNRIHAQEVGFFPSVFPEFTPNTILTYHSPNLRYIRLFAPDTRTLGGHTFVAWRQVRSKLPPRPIVADSSWVKNGLHPHARVPVEKDEFFGSYTPTRGDLSRGTLKIGPFDIRERVAIGIPFMTGPDHKGLSISVVNHKTGAALAELTPSSTPRWAIWRAEVSPEMAKQVDVIANDRGGDWGQWLGLGYPLLLK